MIRDIIDARASHVQDKELVAFVRSATAQLIRSPRLSELAGLLGRFGPAVKDAFSANVNNTTGHAAFDTIINNRIQVAHTTGTVNLTLRELQQRYEESKAVLREFAAALKVAHPL